VQIYLILVSNGCYQTEMDTQVLHAIMAMLDIKTSQKFTGHEQARGRIVTSITKIEAQA